MENEDTLLTESPLTLFLEYDFLRVDQQASFLWSLGGIYDAILPHIEIPPRRISTQEFHFFYRPYMERQRAWPIRAIYGPPMCLVSCSTEHSLTVKFGNGKERFSKTEL